MAVLQFVRLVNTGDRVFDYHYQSQKHLIAPGADRIVPWDCASSLFGDPFTMDSSSDRARTRVYKQTRGFYNYSDGTTTEEQWEVLRPKIEVYDLETNQRIFMVIEDPDGRKTGDNPTPDQAGSDVETMQRTIAVLSQQVESLLSAQQQQAADPARGQGPLVSRDAPNVDGPSQSNIDILIAGASDDPSEDGPGDPSRDKDKGRLQSALDRARDKGEKAAGDKAARATKHDDDPQAVSMHQARE